MAERFIRMKGFAQVSYRSGIMSRGNNYNVKDIEGGMETAKRMVDDGIAIWIKDPEIVSTLKCPRNVLRAEAIKNETVAENEPKTIDKKALKAEAKARKEAKLADLLSKSKAPEENADG